VADRHEPGERLGYGEPGVSLEAHRVHGLIGPDPGLNHPAWSAAPPTPRFVDIGDGHPAPWGTWATVLWDDDVLHVGYRAEEPFVSATSTARDSLLFFENDLELFIDGRDAYYELEFTALGTVYEVFFVWRDAYLPGSRWDVPRFDVHRPSVHSFAGDHPHDRTTFWDGAHPRGTRWAFLDYDLPGMTVDVHVDGRINDDSHVDAGWTAHVRIPWSGLADLADGRALPPRDGDVWGMFFGRFQQLKTREPGRTIGLGYAANAHGVNDTHLPESWTQVRFTGSAEISS